MIERGRLFAPLVLLFTVTSFTLLGARADEGLSPTEQAIVRHVDEHRSEAVELLERVVNINSGTMNHEGVRGVGRVFQEELAALGFETRWVSMPGKVNRAGHLFAERHGTRGKRLLLIGHIDTVFETNSPFQRFVLDSPTTATGPGISDMKGGDVVIVQALKALHAAGALDDATIVVAMIGDEERPGKPLSISRRDLIDAARRSDAALGFEGGQKGKISVARRGSSGWRLTVSGKRAHSSRIFSKNVGSGAIFEAARILYTFHEEVRGEPLLTFNPGTILGGTTVEYDSAKSQGTAFGKGNVVAQTVTVRGGLRFITETQKERARKKMRAIVTEGNLPGTSATISFSDSYPAMPPTEGNRAMQKQFDRVSRDLGFGGVKAQDPAQRGAADISFVAPYVSGIDGLGVYGSGAHSEREKANLDSLPLAAKRAAVLIYRLTHEPRPSPPE